MLSAITQVSGFLTPGTLELFKNINAQMLPVLGLIFTVGLFLRFLLFASINDQAKFTKAFEKQVRDLSSRNPALGRPFAVSVKETLEATIQGPAFKKSLLARLLLLREGVARLTKDTVAQIETMRGEPAFYEISKTAFAKNNFFNRVVGLMPVGSANGLVNHVPGMLIFVGIVGGLVNILGLVSMPAFTGATADLAAAEKGLTIFMKWLGVAMNNCAVAAGLALGMMVLNFLMAPERTYVRMVDRFANTLEELKKVSAANGSPEISVRRSEPAPEKEHVQEEVTEDFTLEEMSQPAPNEAEAGREDRQLTQLEELALSPEELRKLSLYDHPEEGARVENEVNNRAPAAPTPAESQNDEQSEEAEEEFAGKRPPKAA